MLDLPSSMLRASWAPAGDSKVRMAERKPESSECSGASTSTSTSSLEKTIIRRSDSSDVLSGRRRISTDEAGAGAAA